MATANPALKTGSKYADLKRRLWFLLGAMVVYRAGTHIPVPGINASVLDDLFARDAVAAGRPLSLVIDGAIVHVQMGHPMDEVMDSFQAVVSKTLRR